MQSTILPRLREKDVSIAIVLPDAADATVRALGERHGIRIVQAPEIDPALSYRYFMLRRYFFEDIKKNPALWSKHLKFLTTEPFAKRMMIRSYYVLNRLSVHVPFVRRLIRKLETSFQPKPEIADILEELDPRVVVATYPVDPLEVFFLREAQQQGIPTVGHLLSWDNVTTKGRFGAPPEYYVAWGPIMRREVQEYYGISRERIYECGVAHFDHHFVNGNGERLRETVTSLGLNPDRPYLLFGMSSPHVSPYEIEVVEWLSEAVNSGTFGQETQLIVRPHPQNVQGNIADPTWLPRLKALQKGRVAVDFPSLEDSGLMWSMTEGDLPHLSLLIRGCAVCLNTGSTLGIDALMHDKPVVMTAFDAHRTDVPWWTSAKRTFTYRYMKTLMSLDGISVTYSFAELQEEINKYLANPSYKSEGRARSRREECGPADGKASLHVARALVDILKRTDANGTFRERAFESTSVPVGYE